MPVNPGSEIGVSITRSLPNSSTRPDKHLERRARFGHVFAQDAHARIAAHLFGQRFADRLAQRSIRESVCVAVSGIDVLVDLLDAGIRRGNRKLHRRVHLRLDFGFEFVRAAPASASFCSSSHSPACLIGSRFGCPLLLFLLRRGSIRG